jgi:hypothetical protein
MLTLGLFFVIVGLILAIIMGIILSANIENTIYYFLFWLMYIISIGTFVNIGLSIYYYLLIKDKSGPRGLRGERGDNGDDGSLGQCDPNCRTGICEDGLLDKIVEIIQLKEKEAGNRTDFTKTSLRNLYIKEKIKSMCQSPQFKQLIPYKGANNLISYLKEIWGHITKNIYDSGGMNYFKTIGAENDWDWVENNPWNEFKKYDVYYWGLDKTYRPKITENCKGGSTTKNNSVYPEYDNFLSGNNPNIYTNPSKKDSKYSILGYLNVPLGKKQDNTNMLYTNMTNNTSTNLNINNNNMITIKNKSLGSPIAIYDAYSYKPNEDILRQYEGGNMKNKSKAIAPMTYLVSTPRVKGCISMDNKGNTSTKECNPYDPQQIFQMEFTGQKDSKLKEFELIHLNTGNKISNNGRRINKSNTNTIYKF